MQPCQQENRSLFAKLQNVKGLDLRDPRGKRYDLTVVLVGVTIALLSNRDGNLPSIDRHLSNHHERLSKVLGITAAGKQPVSRSQLPLILERVAVEIFDRLLFESLGARLTEQEKHLKIVYVSGIRIGSSIILKLYQFKSRLKVMSESPVAADGSDITFHNIYRFFPARKNLFF